MNEAYQAGLRDAVLTVAHARHAMKDQAIAGPEQWAGRDEGLAQYSQGLSAGQELMRQADAITDETARMAFVAQVMSQMQRGVTPQGRTN